MIKLFPFVYKLLYLFVCSLFDREINNPNLLSAPRQHTITPLSTARRAFEEKLTAFRNQLDMLGFAQSARIKYVQIIDKLHTPCPIPGSIYDEIIYWKIHSSKLLAVEFATCNDENWMLCLLEKKGELCAVMKCHNVLLQVGLWRTVTRIFLSSFS